MQASTFPFRYTKIVQNFHSKPMGTAPMVSKCLYGTEGLQWPMAHQKHHSNSELISALYLCRIIQNDALLSKQLYPESCQSVKQTAPASITKHVLSHLTVILNYVISNSHYVYVVSKTLLHTFFYSNKWKYHSCTILHTDHT